MTLIDAGPLVALTDHRDPHHKACVAVLPSLLGPLVTTWANLTEAMHILGSRGGWRAQSPLMTWVCDGRLQVDGIETTDLPRLRDLMAKYADVPMDIGDACLVALAERLGTDLVFTVDADFRLYRLKGRRAFRVVP